MLKKLYIYASLFLLTAMSACSTDDLEIPSGLDEDGVLTVNLAVPEMETVVTRADEFKVSEVTMLVLSSAGVEDAKTFSLDDPELQENTSVANQYLLKCTLTPEQRKLSGLKFYFIANLPSSVVASNLINKTEYQLKAETSLKTPDYLNAKNYLTMSGSVSLAELRQNNLVSLSRNVAKVTVSNGVKDEKGNWTPGNENYPLEVYGTASVSSVISGAITGKENIGTPVQVSSVPFTGKSEAYIHRTSNPGRDKDARPFIIVKAPYQGQNYFYRLEFENVDLATKKVNTLDILSNHYYQVIIEDITGKGDATPEDALKNPTSLIKSTVYDYSPAAFNMITDGTRELGVSSRISHNGNPSVSGSPEYLYIKIFSIDSNELSNQQFTIRSNVNWLTFGSISPYNNSFGTPIPGIEGDYKGAIYRVPVYFNKTLDPGELSGKITVTWKGLQREVPVIWTRDFDASELCTVKLEIRDNANQLKFSTDDYWTFIRDKNRINGLTAEQNNGKARNEGLHFPVNYGGQGARWTYTYTVSFNNLNDGNNYDWRVKTEGLTGISISTKEGKNINGKATFTITQDGSMANWDYQVGRLIFEISAPNANNYVPYDIDLYHTGFFDNPYKFRNENHRVDQTEKDYFFYYEVISGPEGSYYWLDRNLGATSAGYYIESEGDIAYLGSVEARGGYYRAAKYNKGNDPDMYADLCPPGFEIPRTDTWNTLRNSANFLTNRSGTYYLTQFTNSKGQTVYFPRSRYYNAGDSKIGESRAGYYWTQTPASGLEKDQIGNWLRYIKFSGSIASYDNAEVEERYGSNGWAMSVRCVNATTPANHIWRTHFNVIGATHVFLYSETPSVDSDGNTVMIRNSVTNWPGTSIGNYSTMGNADGTGSGTQSFNFVYESPNTNPTEFYVIFTFRDINGIWHTMSKNGSETLYSTNKRMSELKGWKVIGDTWNGKTTALGGTWTCNFSGSSATVKYSDPGYTPPVVEPLPQNLTIYYTNPNNWGQVYVYAWSGDGSVKNAAWPGVLMTKEGNRWVGTIESKFQNIIFNAGNGGPQTSDIAVERENNHVYNNWQK